MRATISMLVTESKKKKTSQVVISSRNWVKLHKGFPDAVKIS